MGYLLSSTYFYGLSKDLTKLNKKEMGLQEVCNEPHHNSPKPGEMLPMVRIWTVGVKEPVFSAMHATLNACILPRTDYREHSMRSRVNQDFFF